jgi:hypothetical protein
VYVINQSRYDALLMTVDRVNTGAEAFREKRLLSCKEGDGGPPQAGFIYREFEMVKGQ